MSLRRRQYDIEMLHIQTLSQKLASKMPQLSDYACNVFADKIAQIDIYLEAFKNFPEIVQRLKALRYRLLKIGTALWIMDADVITNLGLKVGKTGMREIHGKESDIEH
jgi:hypothetical protein